MNVRAKRTLLEFWTRHPQAESPLSAWYTIASKATWTTSAEIKAAFGANVDFVQDNRVIFDIGGNKYRLVAHVSYRFKTVLIKFVGTHAEYSKIDAGTV